MTNEQQKSTTSRPIVCECGGQLRPARFDVYDFSDYVGLKVTVSDVDGYKCTKCGGETVDGALLNMVMSYTTMQVTKSPRRLNGAEVRYLRHSLHATQDEMARHMGINRVTLADWERGAQSISPEYDYMLRGLALSRMVEADLIEPEQMRETLGTVFGTVRCEPPKESTPPIMVSNPSMMKTMAPVRNETRA